MERLHSLRVNQRKYVPLSLRSLRFRGVWEQRKTEERDFRCFARAKNGARAKKRKRGLGEGKETLPHPPLSLFGFRPIFRAGKKPKIPFLGLSLLPNPTEKQATYHSSSDEIMLANSEWVSVRRKEKGKFLKYLFY